MSTKIGNEDSILDLSMRMKIISDIEGPENSERKDISKKRYEVFKDNTAQFVIENLRSELGHEVVKEIIHRTSNISICRKIVDKKALVYKDGARRTLSPLVEDDQVKLDELIDITGFNSVVKKVNSYLELFKNTEVYIYPYYDSAQDAWDIKLKVLRPHDYDVVEDAENPEIGRVYVFSYYTSADASDSRYADVNESGFHDRNDSSLSFRAGDQRDQTIADSPSDEGANDKEYVWWTNKFHFTTDGSGRVIKDKSPEDLLNPIGELPFVNFSKDKDGSFWALGGEDLVDGSILINMLLTDLYYIAKLQGMGIFYLFGKGVPKSIKVGPSDAIILETNEESPEPKIGFASSNPPIEAHMKMIEQYLAMLLSTNNLEVNTIQGELKATSANSGIQEMIRRAENTDDIEYQREQYKRKEPEIFRKLIKWINFYGDKNLVAERFEDIVGLDPEHKIKLTFNAPSQFMTEGERLEIIEKRRDLSLDSVIDSMIRDNPELTLEEAESKVVRILEERLKFNMLTKQILKMGGEDENKEEDDKEINEGLEEKEEGVQEEEIEDKLENLDSDSLINDGGNDG